MGGGGGREGGGGGGAGDSVAGDDSITLGDRWRRPGELHFSLSPGTASNISGDPDGAEGI